jgi:hypothetical protein
MAPFSVDDRAEKGGSLIRAFGRSQRVELQNVFILERDCDWGVCGCFDSPDSLASCTPVPVRKSRAGTSPQWQPK